MRELECEYYKNMRELEHAYYKNMSELKRIYHKNMSELKKIAVNKIHGYLNVIQFLQQPSVCRPYSSLTPAAFAASIVSSLQMELCTSPICALRRKNIQMRDCPIPPPIV